MLPCLEPGWTLNGTGSQLYFIRGASKSDLEPVWKEQLGRAVPAVQSAPPQLQSAPLPPSRHRRLIKAYGTSGCLSTEKRAPLCLTEMENRKKLKCSVFFIKTQTEICGERCIVPNVSLHVQSDAKKQKKANMASLITCALIIGRP